MMAEQSGTRLDIPALSYFSFGNAYTGSCGGKFRYRIVKQEQALFASVWHTDICCALAEDKTVQEFPESVEGLQACVEWLTQLAQTAAG